jgi:nucleotide-binding universal stress UspA family protein
VATATPTTQTDNTNGAHGGRGTIVCGVDDTPGAIAALDAAAELSNRLDLRLVLVAVADVIVDDDGRPIESLTTNHAREGARKLLRRLGQERELPPGAELRNDIGAPAEALARAAQEERADLLVIGSRKPSLLRPRAAFQLADELSAAAPCPVLVVPFAARN